MRCLEYNARIRWRARGRGESKESRLGIPGLGDKLRSEYPWGHCGFQHRSWGKGRSAGKDDAIPPPPAATGLVTQPLQRAHLKKYHAFH